MKRGELLLGGLLAGALVAGFLLTRGSGVGDDAGPAVVLDLSGANGELAVENITVGVTAAPRPLRVFDELRFEFRFAQGGEPIVVTEPRIDFNMTMDMGPHGYGLVEEASGTWVVNGVVLPQCGSGSRVWFGDLEFQVEGRPRTARVRLELEPPRAD